MSSAARPVACATCGDASGLHARARQRRRKAFGVLVDEAPVERAVVAEPAEQAVPQLCVGAGPDGEMQVGALAGGRAARIDVDDAHAALGARHLDALVEDRVAPGRIRADQHDEIGELQVVVALRHDVGAEGAAVAGHRGGHAQARVGVDVRRADEALGQLVGDVIVLGQQLAREVEGDRLAGRAPRPCARCRGDVVDRLVPADAPPPISGCSSRVSRPSVSPSAEPFEHSRPKLAGWSGSPAMAAPPLPSGVASTPQPTPQ